VNYCWLSQALANKQHWHAGPPSDVDRPPNRYRCHIAVRCSMSRMSPDFTDVRFPMFTSVVLYTAHHISLVCTVPQWQIFSLYVTYKMLVSAWQLGIATLRPRCTNDIQFEFKFVPDLSSVTISLHQRDSVVKARWTQFHSEPSSEHGSNFDEFDSVHKCTRVRK